MNEPREPARSGDEQDAIHARDLYKFTKRPGVVARLKRAIRRRERHKRYDRWED